MCLAIPAQIVEPVDPDTQLATAEVAGVRCRVNAWMVELEGEPVAPGDWVLVHVGFALARIDEAEALATLELLAGLGEDFEQEVSQLERSAGA